MAITIPRPRARNVRIVATLGPASRTPDMIEKLIDAGADVFRVNMSHGTREDRASIIEAIRSIETRLNKPLTIMVDLQGPKLRVGAFAEGGHELKKGQAFRFDLNDAPGTAKRVCLPHREVFAAMRVDATLLVDDGKVKLRAVAVEPDHIDCIVEVPGRISNHKGVNIPDVIVPLAALTDKDRRDLAFALDMGVDWVALSFVQRPEDVAEARKAIGGRAGILAKIEKPSALEYLDEILDLADAVMVARGDLGVELPQPQVPPLQKRIVAAARAKGKAVVVATQMLESMIVSPTPTRAEVSDVANAIYDGADAVMLSAESAAGQYPVEAVSMMNAIALQVETDPGYAARLHFIETRPEPTAANAITLAAAQITNTLGVKAIVCFTTSGSTARRASRERPAAPILVLTPKLETARRIGMFWGMHAIRTRDVTDFEEMLGKAKRMALRSKIAVAGDRIVITAGFPFGTPGATNLLHIALLQGNELRS